MSLLDDDNDIEYSGAIVNARKYVEELYTEADKKRVEIVNHLWALQAKKIGVPQGTTTTEAWNFFRDAITFDVMSKSVEMFDLPPSYQKTIAKVQYLDNYAKRLQSELNDTIRRHCESLQKNKAMAKELLQVIRCHPDANYDREVVINALDIVYGNDWWTFDIDRQFDMQDVPAIIQRCEEHRQRFNELLGTTPQKIIMKY